MKFYEGAAHRWKYEKLFRAMQIYEKQNEQACLWRAVSINLYGEKAHMSKRKASKRRFANVGSELLRYK